MSRAHLVLNELSFNSTRVAQQHNGVDLLKRLALTIRSIRRSVAQHDEDRIVPVVPDGLGAKCLPDGTTVQKALHLLSLQDQDAAALLRRVLSTGPWFDDQGLVISIAVTSDRASAMLLGRNGAGLRAALDLGGLTVSIDIPPWQVTPLSLMVTTDTGATRTEALENLWTPVINASQLLILGKHVSVLPDYEDPGHHEPDSLNYVQGKSHLPRAAEQLLRHSVPSDASKTTWWARCEHEFFHRFQGTPQGQRLRVHWNGTTNPKARETTQESVIPIDVRNRLRQMEPARNCGCRELT